ncbi:hypothetical protein RHGRI_014379 [Rhododendron griersonianum]|uniref:Small ribosomal subunit protein mS41 SAM domain-containing protein n=1 Tax=Rhododendron griersonianum TaxID=479676 RepID=A0AAV6K9D3_9ERIC|nr:hypothetical protein RHGRI_014379 [Rhododendron griersonianum]
MAWRQLIPFNRKAFSTPSNLVSGFASFSSKSTPYEVKAGIPEFLKGVEKGVESHLEKLESEIGDLHKFLVTRTLKLKKLGIPCKQRKLILKFAHKYRVGLWRPRADLVIS